MIIREKLDLLRRMTAVTCGEDEAIDRDNYLFSMAYFDRSLVHMDFVRGLAATLGIGTDDIEIAEAFVSPEILDRYPVEVHDEDSHSFGNLMFRVDGPRPSVVLDAAVSVLRGLGDEAVEKVCSVVVSSESGYGLLKLGEGPLCFELL